MDASMFESLYVYICDGDGMVVTHLGVADRQVRPAGPAGQRQTNERLPLVDAPRHLLFVRLDWVGLYGHISTSAVNGPLY